MPDLSVCIAPDLVLSNPVMTASGTFGYGTEYEELIDIQRLGAIVCKGIFLQPREGNPQPRLYETASGVLNSIGLQGIGVEALIAEKAPVWADWRVPVIVNIAGNTIDEYAELARRLNNVPGISGLEVNISCPNVKAGGASFGAVPEMAARVTTAVKAATTLPVLVKLTPNNTDIVKVAVTVEKAGADALTVTNSLKGMVVDIDKRRPYFANITAGLSGPAIKPLALALVWDVVSAVSIPVIGCGGIYTAQDALEFLMAGASAVQIGSATFANPRASLDVLDGMTAFMEQQKIVTLQEIIGSARK